MTRYAVIELGKVLGLWLLVAVVFVASAGALLWLSWFATAHALAWVYRRRGFRAVVLRDGIEIRVRRWPKPFRARSVTAEEFAEFEAKWTAAHGKPGRNARRVEIVGGTNGGSS